MAFKLDAKIPAGALAEKWSNHKAAIKVVSPANKRKLDIIVIGTGLGGGAAAASLGELGYNVKVFCIQDSPRRAHSIAAQGGINAAKNYQNDNDSASIKSSGSFATLRSRSAFLHSAAPLAIHTFASISSSASFKL